jgi:hypothetical protein
VAHVFLETPDDPGIASYEAAALPALRGELAAVAGGVLRREYPVSAEPHRALCAGCPGEGGLCSWPLESTRRESVDRLF